MPSEKRITVTLNIVERDFLELQLPMAKLKGLANYEDKPVRKQLKNYILVPTCCLYEFIFTKFGTILFVFVCFHFKSALVNLLYTTFSC